MEKDTFHLTAQQYQQIRTKIALYLEDELKLDYPDYPVGDIMEIIDEVLKGS
jgi:hypothetical protein